MKKIRIYLTPEENYHLRMVYQEPYVRYMFLLALLMIYGHNPTPHYAPEAHEVIGQDGYYPWDIEFVPSRYALKERGVEQESYTGGIGRDRDEEPLKQQKILQVGY